jgi:hypothetical protein
MFFRRKRPHNPTFEERLAILRRKGFGVERLEASRARLRRGVCAALVVEDAILRAGIEIQGEIATLVDGGFQKFLETSAGVREPVLASQLKDLHDFEEDLRAGLGLTSLYNQSLGTTFDRHAYDGLKK